MIKFYRNTKTKEIVYEEDATEYALDQLGIKIEPAGKNGEYTKEQFEFVFTFTEWYFSDNWVEEVEQEQEEGNIFELIKEENELND